MLTNTELGTALCLLRWNINKAAVKLGKHRCTISLYKSGKKKIPYDVERIIRLELKNNDNFRNTRKPIESMQNLLRE